ncbi:hypothetical protein BSKO_07815 [Bryopsis sp. KO-2023]|nr:hypothetical protein BSKO_07815 [Bryopsis sp. KO-2023]
MFHRGNMPPLLRHRCSEDSDSVLKGGKALSMVSRVQQKVDELRKNFGLPDEEMFMDEFYCALHKKILFQGRMYIFENYVCFYSNLFGWVKKKTIPMREITDVAKKRNYGFPNSIQIGWKGKREFFTSFLSRDDAYVLIVNAWNQARLSMSSEQLGADNFKEGRRYSEPGSARSRDPDMDEEPPSDSPHHDGMKHRRASSDLPDFRSDGRSLEKSSLDHDSDSDLEDDDSDCWAVQSGEVPPVPEAMDMIMEAHFSVPVREFFQKTLSSESIFLEEYHRTRGDQRLRLSQWQKHSGLEGMVRHSTFVSPVKAPGGFRVGLISPKETECNQNQRYRVYGDGDTLVFETSQVMKDIPYGDNFTVEMRWDITRVVNRGTHEDNCRVTIYGSVPFIRHVISPIRMMIESSVMKELRNSVAQLFENMRVALAASSSQSATEASVEAPIRAEYNLDELLSRQELRTKLLGLLRESLEDSERIELLGKTSSVEHPQQTDSKIVQSPMEQPLPWADRFTSYIPSVSMNFFLLIGIVVLFMFQILTLFLCLYPPVPYNRGYGQYPSDIPQFDRVFWRESLNYMNQDLHSLHGRLEGLAKGVEAALEQVREVKFNENNIEH